MRKHYVTATGEEWRPRGLVTALNGRETSAENALDLLNSGTPAQADVIRAEFGLTSHDWPPPPAGQEVTSEDVTPGPDGLTFVQVLRAVPAELSGQELVNALEARAAAAKAVEERETMISEIMAVHDYRIDRASAEAKLALIPVADIGRINAARGVVYATNTGTGGRP